MVEIVRPAAIVSHNSGLAEYRGSGSLQWGNDGRLGRRHCAPRTSFPAHREHGGAPEISFAASGVQIRLDGSRTQQPAEHGATTAHGVWGTIMARILFIDDEDSSRIDLRQLLESWGYEVIEACGGGEGLARYRDDPTDVVIMDIIMPECRTS
jgi:Response regulator receiver domain